MSVIKETLVVCDDCSEQCGGDDRDLTAAQIRARRKRHGWIQIGSNDYCDECAPKHSRKPVASHPNKGDVERDEN